METLREIALETSLRMKSGRNKTRVAPAPGLVKLFRDPNLDFGNHLCPGCGNLQVNQTKLTITCTYPGTQPIDIAHRIMEDYKPEQITCDGYRRPNPDEVLARLGQVYMYTLKSIEDAVTPAAIELSEHVAENLRLLLMERLEVAENPFAKELIDYLARAVEGEGNKKSKPSDADVRIQFYEDKRRISKGDREIFIGNTMEIGNNAPTFTIQLRSLRIVDQQPTFLPLCEIKVRHQPDVSQVTWSTYNRFNHALELATYPASVTEETVIDQLVEWFETR